VPGGRELCTHDLERPFGAREVLLEPVLRTLRASRETPQSKSVTRVGDGSGACVARRRTHAISRGPNAPRRTRSSR